MEWSKVRIAMMLAMPVLLIGAVSSDDAESPYTRVTLSGRGYSSQTAEFVAVQAATETFSTSPSRAMRANAADMDRLRGRLKQLGVTEADFRTANFSFQTGSDPNDNDGDRDRGYIVNHQLSILVRDKDKAGEVMDALVDAGAKNLQVNRYWGYSQDIDERALKEARAGAIRDARAKADDYAKALGMRIHRIVSVSDQGGYSRDQPAPMARMAAYDAAPTQIDTRPSTVLASVGMVVDLEK